MVGIASGSRVGMSSSLLKKGGGKALKRPADDFNSSDNDSDGAKSTVKRVRFADVPPSPVVMDQKTSLAVFKKSVEKALEGKKAGDSQRYDELRNKFSVNPSDPSAPDSTELAQFLSVLSHFVGSLNGQCVSLPHVIFKSNWAGREDKYVDKYMQFVIHVVSAHSVYAHDVVRMLVKHLTFQPLSIGRLPGLPPVPRQKIFDRAHQALAAILNLVPTAWTAVFPTLQAAFPHKDEKRIYHTSYITNLLRVITYAPTARMKVLGLIIDRIIQIDVEMQGSSEDLEDAEAELLDAQMNGLADSNMALSARMRMAEELEHDEDDGSDTTMSMEGGTEGNVEKIVAIAGKVDAMLELVFEYFSTRFPAIMPAEPTEEMQQDYDLLLHYFEITILPTFRSKFTQYLLFWAAQKSPYFTELFLGTLIVRARDNSIPQISRQAAANYVASFVARAGSLSRESVRTVINVLCAWLKKFVEDRESECSGPDVAKFGGFYAITQAVLYIFCFRWRDLRGRHNVLDEDEESGIQPTSWQPDLDIIQRLITSRFNPLKVCSPTVVKQFADIARHLNFVYCFSILERNKRTILSGGPVRGGVQIGRTQEVTQLESYFPFDPCKLPLVKRWTDSLYVEWLRVPGLDDFDDEDSEESGDDTDDDDEDEDEDDEDEAQ